MIHVKVSFFTFCVPTKLIKATKNKNFKVQLLNKNPCNAMTNKLKKYHFVILGDKVSLLSSAKDGRCGGPTQVQS